MSYTKDQRDRFIAAIRDEPIHFSDARDKAGIPDRAAVEILVAGYAAKMIAITDHGPGEHGMLSWRGA